jgi:hypothetical protein
MGGGAQGPDNGLWGHIGQRAFVCRVCRDWMAVEAVCRELVSEFPAIREKYREFFVFLDLFLNTTQFFKEQSTG